MNEHDILELLAAHGFKAIRVNAGYARRGKRYIRLADPGWSDVFGFHKRTGQIIAIERKGEDKLSEKQSEFLETVRAAGGIAGVAHTPEDVLDLIKTMGNIIVTSQF